MLPSWLHELHGDIFFTAPFINESKYLCSFHTFAFSIYFHLVVSIFFIIRYNIKFSLNSHTAPNGRTCAGLLLPWQDKSSAFCKYFYYAIHFKILLKTNCIFIFMRIIIYHRRKQTSTIFLRYWYQKGTYIWKRKIYLGFARM